MVVLPQTVPVPFAHSANPNTSSSFPPFTAHISLSKDAPVIPSPPITYPTSPAPLVSPHLKCLPMCTGLSSQSLWQNQAPLRLLLSPMATAQHPHLQNQRLLPVGAEAQRTGNLTVCLDLSILRSGKNGCNNDNVQVG